MCCCSTAAKANGWAGSSAWQNPARKLALREQTRSQRAAPDLWLVFAAIKRIDNLAEKATELGSACLWPIFTQHTNVSRVNVERLRANAIEAAEQSERLDIPDIRTPAKLGEVLASWSPARRLILCAELGEAAPIAEALRGMPADAPYAVMSGPEGGFARSELDALSQTAFCYRGRSGASRASRRHRRTRGACLLAGHSRRRPGAPAGALIRGSAPRVGIKRSSPRFLS